MNKKVLFTLLWILAPVLIIGAAHSYYTLVSDTSEDSSQVCLLVEDIGKDSWQAIHYGTSQYLAENRFLLSTYNFSHRWLETEEKINPCPTTSEVIVNAWEHNKFLARGSVGRMSLIGNSFDDQILKPDFSIGAYFAPQQKAKLITEFIAEKKGENDRATVALVLGPGNMRASELLVQFLREEFNASDGVSLHKVSFADDTKFEQYVAMSQLLVDGDDIDFLIATPTAIEQASKIISGRELEDTTLISISGSRAVLALLEQGKVDAMVDDKAVLQGRWLAKWISQAKITQRPEIDFKLALLTSETVAEIERTESFVPYGYRVIYNSGKQ